MTFPIPTCLAVGRLQGVALPPWLLALTFFAVFVLPGGIPLTAVLLPIYLRRAASRAAA